MLKRERRIYEELRQWVKCKPLDEVTVYYKDKGVIRKWLKRCRF